jgi:hypothetical protein
MKATVSTSAFFLIPSVLALFADLPLYSLVIFFTMLSSILYHRHKQSRLFWLDCVMSVSLMLFNFSVLYRSGFRKPFLLLISLMVLISFYFWHRAHKKNYALNHSIWHLASVLITLLCLFAYLL